MTDGCLILSRGYARSPSRGFEAFFRLAVGLDEDDLQLVSKQYNSNFVTHEIPPGIYSIEDFSN